MMVTNKCHICGTEVLRMKREPNACCDRCRRTRLTRKANSRRRRRRLGLTQPCPEVDPLLDPGYVPLPPGPPCCALPGTVGRIMEYRRRVAEGRAVFHPKDIGSLEDVA